MARERFNHSNTMQTVYVSTEFTFQRLSKILVAGTDKQTIRDVPRQYNVMLLCKRTLEIDLPEIPYGSNHFSTCVAQAARFNYIYVYIYYIYIQIYYNNMTQVEIKSIPSKYISYHLNVILNIWLINFFFLFSLFICKQSNQYNN